MPTARSWMGRADYTIVIDVLYDTPMTKSRTRGPANHQTTLEAL